MLDRLNNLKEQELVYTQVHPSLDLTIWNYNDSCQYNNSWDIDELLLDCRGLVTNSLGKKINNPIPKFFNYTETKGKYVCNFNKPFQIYTKYDGSLIMVFYYNNELIVCSRGSFTSKYAEWAKGIINKEKYTFDKGLTYCFELITPENRIVVNYGDERRLILLAVRTQKYELDIKDFNQFNLAQIHKINIKEYKDLKKLSELNLDNEEGYVFKFGEKRCKVKFDEYVRLHKLMTNVTTTAIWECLKNKTDLMEVLKDVPDEYYQKIKEYCMTLQKQWSDIFTEVLEQSQNIPRLTKKEFIEYTNGNIYQMLLIELWKNNNISENIWDLLKPKFEKL